MTILEAALKYQAIGYSVIPVDQKKIPLIKWLPYQNKRASEEEIRYWFKKFPDANIGIVTGEISNLFVVDTDNSESTERIQSAIPDNLVVPCQRTPSGFMHFLFSHCPGFSNRAKVADQIDVRTSGGYFVAAPSINGNGKGWEWVVSPFDADPPDLALAVKEILINSLNSLLYIETTNHKPQITTTTTSDHKFFDYGMRDDSLFHVANAMVKNHSNIAMISEVLERLILSWGENPDKRWIDAKIKSALDRTEKKERNIMAEVEEWVMTTTGHFLTTECHNGLQMTTRNEKKAVVMALSRLKDTGIIEKVPPRNGVYRRIIREDTEINWEFCDDTIIDVKWPFDLQKYYLCLPKNVIVIAGNPDAGKTAMCLNFAMLNMEKHQIKYFSSEMGALELKVRLKKFGIPFNKWKQVKFIERSSNFADVIEPDGINIVDYIEVPEEAWKIATPINEIFRKLNKGICVIALQKPRGRDVARGGESTLDRPRLYLSMGSGQIKIVKCKNWANEDKNPNGLSLEYKIVQGCKFIQSSDWSISWDEVRK